MFLGYCILFVARCLAGFAGFSGEILFHVVEKLVEVNAKCVEIALNEIPLCSFSLGNEQKFPPPAVISHPRKESTRKLRDGKLRRFSDVFFP